MKLHAHQKATVDAMYATMAKAAMIPADEWRSSNAFSLGGRRNGITTAQNYMVVNQLACSGEHATAAILELMASRRRAAIYIDGNTVEAGTFAKLSDAVFTLRHGLQFQGALTVKHIWDEQQISWAIKPLNATWRYNHLMNSTEYLDALTKYFAGMAGVMPPVDVLDYDILTRKYVNDPMWYTPEAQTIAAEHMARIKSINMDEAHIIDYLNGKFEYGDYDALKKDNNNDQ